MGSTSNGPPVTKILGEAESKIAQSLVTGHAPSFADAALEITPLKEAVFTSFVNTICHECSTLCQRVDSGLFRNIPVTDLADMKWQEFIEELQCKAPTLLQILTTIVSFNDHRNTTKVGSSHHPGIIAAVAVLLKERSREMVGVQSIVSVMMYSCHCEKQVHNKETNHTYSYTLTHCITI